MNTKYVYVKTRREHKAGITRPVEAADGGAYLYSKSEQTWSAFTVVA